MYGLRFGRRRDSYEPVGTCCLLIKCKRAASLSLDNPPRERGREPSSPLCSLLPSFRLPLSLSIQKPEAALVSHRNQPRADNNEIHKSVREHAETHPAPPRVRVSHPLLPLFLSFSLCSFPPATLWLVCVHARRYLSLPCQLSPSCDPRPSLIIVGESVFTILRERREDRVTLYMPLRFGPDHRMRSKLHRWEISL